MDEGKEYGDKMIKKKEEKFSLKEDFEEDSEEETPENPSEDSEEDFEEDSEEEKPRNSFWDDDDIEEEAEEKKPEEDSEESKDGFEEETPEEDSEDSEEEPEKKEEKAEKKPKELKASVLTTWQVITAVLAVLLIVSIFTNGFRFTPTGATVAETEKIPAPTPEPTPTVERVAVSADDDPVKGPANAKITIIEFSDYQCPFCARAEPTMNQIIDTYKDDIKIVYRDFPLGFHENAQKAAEASECADEQGKFWEYHDKLFANQGALDIPSLKAYAIELKLNSAQFNQCLDSGKYEPEVKKDLEDGKAAGVSGTPAFFINGRLVSGAQPFDNFKKVIDEELGK